MQAESRGGVRQARQGGRRRKAGKAGSKAGKPTRCVCVQRQGKACSVCVRAGR